MLAHGVYFWAGWSATVLLFQGDLEVAALLTLLVCLCPHIG